MKGSQGKKKRNKQAFMMKVKQRKREEKEQCLLNKIRKWEKRGWDTSQLIKKYER